MPTEVIVLPNDPAWTCMFNVVSAIELVDTRNAEMGKLGYEVMGEYGIPTRRFFRKLNSVEVRTHHVHVFAQGNPHVHRHLAFRDFLNAHPQWATEYSELKRALAVKHADSMECYHNGKCDFIMQIDQLAAAWNRCEPGSEPEPLMNPS